MPVSRFAKIPLYALAVVGLGAMTLGSMLATPLKRPPPLASIHAGAARLDRAGLPDLSRFQARDGTWLAYRLYPAGSERVAILVHGSSAAAYAMNGVAKALAAAGVTAVAIDVRGHGASGERGDIGYVGEIDDDLADLIDALRPAYPNARFNLIGHSLGGGFAARVAGSPLGRRFDRFVLLAPFLGPEAPTNRPNDGKGHWVEVDRPRVLALVALSRLGVTLGQSLPVIAYANAPGSRAASVYSYRLLTGLSPSFDWGETQRAIRSAKLTVICGADDELMDAQAYARELKPLGAEVKIIAGADHMGVLSSGPALAAVVEAVADAPDVVRKPDAPKPSNL
jgi:pimeloyl-ACP methyl ester carboxylesterase